CEIWVSSAGAEDDHPPLFQMPHRPSADERFTDLFHLDGGKQTSFDAQLFQRILQCHTVDDRSQHAHVIGLHAVHSGFFRTQTPINIPTADDDGNLHSFAVNFLDIPCILCDAIDIDTVLLLAHQGFTTEFEERPVANA